MLHVALPRLISGDQGTFGKLIVGNKVWTSLELPWRDNKPKISCLPPDNYLCKWSFSKRFNRYLYEIIENILEREGFRFHPANWAGDISKGFYSQLEGCIALGNGYLQMIPEEFKKKQWAISDSVNSTRSFEAYLNHKDFMLHIIDLTEHSINYESFFNSFTLKEGK